ncbi:MULTISPECIES: NAD(P)H-dependent oxidoreductase subunit E [unclassified Thermosipho (in: thermotogales)]|uniref:NAD(P)H-dependent oxidoreductase subunit E n=1 Tax=unclassified Thermosipho (in: thermotogales) TaxID=2676525 RepID=UPI0009848D4F|nr:MULTISPECIES: NAD(P)H-dependent oxidoreductase subunit E [unclassified Thermosipho (in: thermotogales)]MBT1247153.1 hypothetical protein [Thermosipho sp. 1244]OOC47094.1 hypothetical protein XO09_03225 [Thermosipho sp. 1223]
MKIKVCMGSSCYLKGSNKVIEKIKNMNLDNLDLRGALCFGKCVNGVNIEINGNLIENITPENVEEVIRKFLEKGDKNERIYNLK